MCELRVEYHDVLFLELRAQVDRWEVRYLAVKSLSANCQSNISDRLHTFENPVKVDSVGKGVFEVGLGL